MRAARVRFGAVVCLAVGMLGGLSSAGHAQKLKAATLLPTPGFVGYLATTDVNNDGIPDLVYTSAVGDNVYDLAVQFGKGDGTFAPPVLSVLPQPTSTLGCCGAKFTLADVNGDGVADALFGATKYTESAIVILLGKRDGSFGAAQVSPMTLDPAYYSGYPTANGHMTIADWNGDGHADLAFTDSIEGIAGIALGDGTGKFTQVQAYRYGGDMALDTTSAADLNGDGKPDFIAGGNSAGAVAVFLNTGGGTFTYTFLNTPYNSTSYLLTDVNGDGKADLLYTGAIPPQYIPTVSVAFGDGNGTFQTAAPVTSYSGPNPSLVQLIDMDGDGKADLLLNTGNGAAYLKGDGTGGFNELTEVSTGPDNLFNYIVAADFNGDGKNDLMASGLSDYNPNNNIAPGLIFAQNLGGGAFDTADLYDSVSNWYSAFVADFNNDGLADVLTYTNTNGAPTVFFGDRSGVLKGFNVVTTPTLGNTQTALIGDVNGDGKIDLIEETGNYSPINWAAGHGDGTFAAPQLVPGTSDPDVAVGVATVQDFNHDNIADLLLASTSQSPTMDFGSKTGPLNPVNVTATELSNIYVDLNGDGLLDIVVPTDVGVDVQFGMTATQFASPVTVLFAQFPRIVVADVDSDGKLDLVVNYESAPDVFTNEIAYGNGDGTFAAPTPLKLPVGSFVAAVADMNLDGNPDLLVIDYFYLYLIHGLGSRQFSATADQYPSAQQLDGVSVGDFNGDGSPDVYVLNSSNSFIVHLNRGGDFGTLTGTPSPAVYGEQIEISATVVETVAGSGTPGGTVSVSVDGTALGNITLENGTGQIADNNLLSVGSHALSAHYPGDGNFNPKSFTGTEVVNKAQTTTDLAAAPLTIVAGESVGLSATVAPEYSGIPTGTVTFSSGTTQVGSGTLNGSAMASTTATGLTAGNYQFTANYGGDGNFLASTSAAQAVVVTDFSLAAAPTSLTTTQGGSTTTKVTVTPLNGFNGAVNLSCTGTTAVTCAFSPSNLNVPGAAATSTLTLTAATNSASLHRHGRGWMVLALLLPMGLLRRRWLGGALLGCSVLATLLTGCGGGSGGGGGGGNTMTYKVTVQAAYAADPTVTRSTVISVVVTQ